MAATLTVGPCPTREVYTLWDIDITIALTPEDIALSIPIETIREHITTIATAQRPQRILVVPFDKVTPAAQNSLLKVLEDTAYFHTWLLYAESLAPILSTIQSRCIIVDARTRPENTSEAEIIVQWLKKLRGPLEVFQTVHTPAHIALFWKDMPWLCGAFAPAIQKKALELERAVRTLHVHPQNALDILALSVAQLNHATPAS